MARKQGSIDCLAMDGRKYSYDAVPPRPHPNCKCTVEPTSPSTAPHPETNPSDENAVKEILLDTGARVRNYLIRKGDQAREVLRDNLNPDEGDGWSMPVFDFIPNEGTHFSVAALQRNVRHELRHKADTLSYCPRWEHELLNRANSYSITDATIDFWYYGDDQVAGVVEDITKETMDLPCSNP